MTVVLSKDTTTTSLSNTTVLGLLLLVILQTLSTTVVTAASDGSSTLSWKLMHSWNGNDYVPRGRIVTVTPGEGGDTNNNDEGDDDDEMVLKVINDATLSTNDVSNLLRYGWYHIRIYPEGGDDDSPVAMATVPACHLRRSNFRDEFMFVVSRSDKDAIISMSYAPLISPLVPKTCEEENLALMRPLSEAESGITFDSKVSDITLDTPGMVLKAVLPKVKPPPGFAFLKNPNRQQGSSTNTKTGGSNAGGEGDGEGGFIPPEEPQGPFYFVKKYWYIFVPLMIMNFVSSDPGTDAAAGPEGGEGGGTPAVAGGAAAAGAATGAVVGGAAAAAGGGGGGSPSKRAARRGKRN